jgi:hypothetical protein
MKFKRKLINTYRKSETCFQNRIDRASPVVFVRFADVEVYRLPWDFFGFDDEEVVTWGEWREVGDVVFGEDRPQLNKIFGKLLEEDMKSRGLINE